MAQLSANNGRTFGLVRAEVLGAFLNGLTLAVACLWIAWEAVWRLSVGVPEVAAFPVLIVGGLGLLINLGSAWALHQSSADNLNLRAAMAHMLADALGSVGAIVAALLVGLGFPAADPILSVVIAVLVGASAWAILRDSSRVLLQLPPAEVDVAELTKTLLATAKVVDVHDVHVWTLDGKRIIVTAHLVVDKEAHLGTVCEAARGSLLKDFGVEHATLQTETSPCIQYGCGVTASA